MTPPTTSKYPADVRLIPPCGGELKTLVVEPENVDELKLYAETLPSISLPDRSLCDLELLATGAFSPLDRFMDRADYENVLGSMRLAGGHIFPIPVTLPVSREVRLTPGGDVALRDARNNPVAVMRVEDVYEWNRADYARTVLGTESPRHPLVTEIARWGDRFVSGELRVIRLTKYYDFPELRLTPSEVRARLVEMGNPNVVGFQTRNPIHRAHEELTKRAMAKTGGTLLLHPVVGLTKPGDIDHYSRVRTYRVLTEKYYEPDSVLLSLLPLAMRFAGPREALWHALIRRNYGANYFIVGRDHASPGTDEAGRPFYPEHAAQELVASYGEELGIGVIPFEELVYLPEIDTYEERSKTSGDKDILAISGTSAREDYLDRGRALPEWFTRREVSDILQDTRLPRHRQGVCVWLTGFSGAGKSTTAEIVTAMLLSFGRRVTLLDGDIVRNNLSAGLGFDREGRDANIRRIGFVASEIVRHGGVAVCAAISPYRATRDEVRKAIGSENFIEVFVDTSLDVCEQRDPKGMYAKARRGEIADFTGIDDAYEEPLNPEMVIDTIETTAEQNARSIVSRLLDLGFVREDGSAKT